MAGTSGNSFNGSYRVQASLYHNSAAAVPWRGIDRANTSALSLKHAQIATMFLAIKLISKILSCFFPKHHTQPTDQQSHFHQQLSLSIKIPSICFSWMCRVICAESEIKFSAKKVGGLQRSVCLWSKERVSHLLDSNISIISCECKRWNTLAPFEHQWWGSLQFKWSHQITHYCSASNRAVGRRAVWVAQGITPLPLQVLQYGAFLGDLRSLVRFVSFWKKRAKSEWAKSNHL